MAPLELGWLQSPPNELMEDKECSSRITAKPTDWGLRHIRWPPINVGAKSREAEEFMSTRHDSEMMNRPGTRIMSNKISDSLSCIRYFGPNYAAARAFQMD